ncbi:sugar phosphate isomerase/epimerase [Pedobacter sp. L105]|uniref:sugar phosphate isomerase/epimerase n=1 Tax=Pedobacter sp. L105 TaxID=1641871 RepID=UPI00131B25FE|nr:sugar phosphate isomerase/epimerase [Pedobacter sp. L105]
MQIKILSPLWGYEQINRTDFLDKIKNAGYDGLDTWLPETFAEKRLLFNYLDKEEMCLVTHQHAAEGSTFKKFRSSYFSNLQKCAEPNPLLINSHTGKDYFCIAQQLELIDTAAEFSAKTGITVVHETHRGRMGYTPQMTEELFKKNKEFLLTADFSHWVCVTESMLENFTDILQQAIQRTRHIHARVGFEQGPQISDPRAPEWQYAVNKFLGWWDEIVEVNEQKNTPVLTMTTEFGPPPYMPVIPFSQEPLADQFTINCYMKDLLRQRYGNYC